MNGWLLSLALATTSGPFVELRMQPERLELTGPFSSAQLVITGVREDGQVVDLTREAAVGDLPEALSVDDRRLFLPREDGEGTLRLDVAGEELSLPYRVEGTTDDAPPSFVRDVEPVLSRSGCNAGTCHGSAQGKNGFQLSLRGYDAEYDHRALTDDLAGRRFNRAAPERSLFLRKPTGAVPHEGGVLMAPGEQAYDLLARWIEHGATYDGDGETPRVDSIRVHPDDPTLPAPGQEQQFRVLATYTDGSERDVTRWSFLESSDTEVLTVDDRGLAHAARRGAAAVLARYEGSYDSTRVFVMGDREGYQWTAPEAHNEIDEIVDRRLQEIQTRPSALCTDAEFLRRVHLDLTGLPPTSRRVRTFLADTRPSRVKRDEEIDRLIGGVEYVEHWTNKWSDLLQVNPKFLGDNGAARLRDWIRGAVASNMPYDRFVDELLTASGSTYDNPPAAYYKVLRKPDEVMENTTQLFLGVRFNCNKCHDHPFERWTKRQHWELAAWFAQVGREDAPGSKRMPDITAAADGAPPAYEEIIRDLDQGTMVNPDDGLTYAPTFPYEYEGTPAPDGASLREQLAAWLIAPENPYFARSAVNRLWSYLLGRGLIDPVDDIRAGNPPSHPELLDHLTNEFVDSGFDVRHVLRLICRSRVYQQSIETDRFNEDDDVHFSHALARRLPAETLFDAVHRAAGARPSLPGTRPGSRAAEAFDPATEAPDGFLDLFGRPPRESACECERGTGLSLGQALNLVNGPTIADAIEDDDNEITRLVHWTRDPGLIVDELTLSFLGRFPEVDERDSMAATLDPMTYANLAALGPDARADLDRRRDAWEASVAAATWRPLEVDAVRALGADLQVLDDGSILASGDFADKEAYTVVARTGQPGITGVRLEALTHDTLGSKGPGRADNGNFVLSRIWLTAIPTATPGAARDLVFSRATADFSQDGWPVAESITNNAAKGWAVHPRPGVAHQAVYELKEDLAKDGGPTVLVFTLEQNYGQKHYLGRFRLSVTSSARPVKHSGLSDDVLAALDVPATERTAAQRDVVHVAFLSTAPDLQLELRLSAARDLAWAMANSPEFLFNH